MAKTRREKIKVSMEAFEEHQAEDHGVCLACGEWSESYHEPDTRNYKCDNCGRYEVFGADEAINIDALEVTEEEEESDD